MLEARAWRAVIAEGEREGAREQGMGGVVCLLWRRKGRREGERGCVSYKPEALVCTRLAGHSPRYCGLIPFCLGVTGEMSTSRWLWVCRTRSPFALSLAAGRRRSRRGEKYSRTRSSSLTQFYLYLHQCTQALLTHIPTHTHTFTQQLSFHTGVCGMAKHPSKNSDFLD